MERDAADLLVRRAQRQNTRFMLWSGAGYVPGMSNQLFLNSAASFSIRLASSEGGVNQLLISLLM